MGKKKRRENVEQPPTTSAVITGVDLHCRKRASYNVDACSRGAFLDFSQQPRPTPRPSTQSSRRLCYQSTSGRRVKLAERCRPCKDSRRHVAATSVHPGGA